MACTIVVRVNVPGGWGWGWLKGAKAGVERKAWGNAHGTSHARRVADAGAFTRRKGGSKDLHVPMHWPGPIYPQAPPPLIDVCRPSPPTASRWSTTATRPGWYGCTAVSWRPSSTTRGAQQSKQRCGTRVMLAGTCPCAGSRQG